MTDDIDDLTDDTDDGDASDGGTDLVRTLRRQVNSGAKERARLEAELAELRTAQRATDLRTAFEAAGAHPGVARFYPTDGATTADAVAAWLAEHADVFGKPAPSEPATTVDQGTAAAMQAVQRAASTAPPAAGTSMEDFQSRLSALDPRSDDFLKRLEEVYASVR